jgi:nucleoside-diphosphate-sugar epimerase
MTVIITGSSGFVGRAVVSRLNDAGVPLRAVVRRRPDDWPPDVPVIQVDDINATTNWSHALRQGEVVLHLAARVHVMREHVSNALAAYRSINVDGTLNLARQAAAAGIKRFVFISSIKVNGDETPVGRPFRAEDIPSPADDYAISKYEAEEGLRRVSVETGMEVVIIRPVLIYGPGVKGNFLLMACWLKKRVPLPLGSISNSRSLLALDNLVDLVAVCLKHPAAANQTFLASDGEDLSTTELLRRSALALGVRPVLIPVPKCIIKGVTWLIGRRDLGRRLSGSLQVNLEKNYQCLNWIPPISVADGLKRACLDLKC